MGTNRQQKRKPWTVMLYMAASKDQRTEQAAIRDLRELERVGTTDKVNVIVQIDREWPGYAERYCVGKGFSEFCEPLPGQKNIDSGKPKVLREFVTWGRTKFPADRYLLVLWGHSVRPGIRPGPRGRADASGACGRARPRSSRWKGRQHSWSQRLRHELRRSGLSAAQYRGFLRGAGDYDAVCGLALREHSERDQ